MFNVDVNEDFIHEFMDRLFLIAIVIGTTISICMFIVNGWACTAQKNQLQAEVFQSIVTSDASDVIKMELVRMSKIGVGPTH